MILQVLLTGHSFSDVAVARDAARLLRRKGLRMKAAIVAVETTEEIMRLLMRSELVRYTREELANALMRNLEALRELPEGSAGRDNAISNLDNIRREQYRRSLSPRGFSR